MKLEHYGTRGKSNSQKLESQQLVSINGTDSVTQIIKHGVPQRSVLGPLLFMNYINDFHAAIFIVDYMIL